jgi:predicted ArsR family transcriptional regulator
METTSRAKDEIFEQSRKRNTIMVGFLQMLKNNFDKGEAYRLALEGFTGHMTEYYKIVLKGTKPQSQERFDRLREHYTEHTKTCSYCTIKESTPEKLKVIYSRCPTMEVLKEYRLEDISTAFCRSDYEFTKNVLPGVKFQRSSEISRGDPICDHTWTFEG